MRARFILCPHVRGAKSARYADEGIHGEPPAGFGHGRGAPCGLPRQLPASQRGRVRFAHALRVSVSRRLPAPRRWRPGGRGCQPRVVLQPGPGLPGQSSGDRRRRQPGAVVDEPTLRELAPASLVCESGAFRIQPAASSHRRTRAGARDAAQTFAAERQHRATRGRGLVAHAGVAGHRPAHVARDGRELRAPPAGR